MKPPTINNITVDVGSPSNVEYCSPVLKNSSGMARRARYDIMRAMKFIFV